MQQQFFPALGRSQWSSCRCCCWQGCWLVLLPLLLPATCAQHVSVAGQHNPAPVCCSVYIGVAAIYMHSDAARSMST
jgi:hypothetical protein